MNLSAIWIRRPVMTILVMASILFFGLYSYRSLPINNLPNVDYPTIQVSASLAGASPETMASTVATPLEKEFTKISGLDSMTSQNSQGSTTITLQFSLERNIDAAAQDVNTAISAARSLLPESMTAPPTYSKVNPSAQPILYFVLTSKTMPMSAVQDYAETFITGYLSTIDGVAEVKVMGAQKKAIRVRVDPQALVARGIGLNEVAEGIKKGNVHIPGGTPSGPYQAFTIDSNGQIPDAEALNRLIISWKNGHPVRIRDIGQAVDGLDYERAKLWFATRDAQYQAIVLAISKQPGANTVKIADDVKAKLPTLVKMMPAAVELFLLYDQSGPIRESINDVQFTLILTIVLVVIVIFLFIRSWRPTLIPGVAVPLSIIATFCVMHLLGFSLNNLSLMALTLSVGFVVDDAVVMMENIIRRMEAGETAMEASLRGSKEIGFTILSMTISLFVVFIPILFMGGIVGRLFREFAVSIGVAILVSGFISLTLTPMLCSRFLTTPAGQTHGRLFAASERIFAGMLAFYARTLRLTLNHRLLTLLFTAAVLALSAVLFAIIPKGFIPAQDSGYYIVYTRADDRASFDYMVAHQEKVNGIVRANPDTKAIFSLAGGGNDNSGFILVTLKDREERQASVGEVIASLRPQLDTIPGLAVYPLIPPSIYIGGRSSNALWQYTLQSNDLEALYRATGAMETKMAALPGLADVNSDLQIKSPKVRLAVDRDKAAALGLSFSQIQDTLYGAFGSHSISTIYGASNEYYIYLELAPEYRRDPSSLALVQIKSASGKLVPLSTIARMEETVVPLTINHSGQLPSATISFNLKEGSSLDRATAEIERLAATLLPDEVTGAFEGASQAFQSSFASLGFLLVVTVFVIYIVLGILYESYLHPITILSALPLAGFGALLALLLFGMELDLYSFVGIIMLVGLVKKNGIMMVDFACEAERTKGLGPAEAIYEASLVRFRPIMMTTMAALFGTLPIALGFGAGSEARQPLGVAVVGGLLFSQLLTLYVTPVFYVYMDRLGRRFRTKAIAGEAAEEGRQA